MELFKGTEDLEGYLKDKINEHVAKDSRKMSQSSVDLYASRVRIIFLQFGGKNSLTEYFNGYARVIKNIEKKYPNPNTLKTSLWSIITVLAALGGKEQAIKKYTGKYNETVGAIERDANDEKNAKEEENWMTMTEIHEKREAMKEGLRGKVGAGLFDAFQQYMVLSLYTLMPPLRNDFVDVLVYGGTGDDVAMDEDKNYIFLDESKLVMNKFKTKGSFGRQTIILPEALTAIITEWMKIRVGIYADLRDRRELLFNVVKMTPMGRSNMPSYMNKIFGRHISTSMLRKIYLSEKYPVVSPSKEMERDAAAMLHSIRTQQFVYRKR
jgi:hypothetical protein